MVQKIQKKGVFSLKDTLKFRTPLSILIVLFENKNDLPYLKCKFKFKQNETTEWTIAYNHYFYKTTTFEDIKYKKLFELHVILDMRLKDCLKLFLLHHNFLSRY